MNLVWTVIPILLIGVVGIFLGIQLTMYDKQHLCESNHGIWNDKQHLCALIDKDTCEDIDGTYKTDIPCPKILASNDNPFCSAVCRL